MPDPAPPNVTVNVAAPLPPDTSPVDPTVRYLVEQAKVAVDAGLEATPEMVAVVSDAVRDYGKAKIVMGGADLAILVGVLALWQWIWRHNYSDDEDRGIARLLSTIVAAIAAVVCLIMFMHDFADGLVAYFSPLVWLAAKMAGAS